MALLDLSGNTFISLEAIYFINNINKCTNFQDNFFFLIKKKIIPDQAKILSFNGDSNALIEPLIFRNNSAQCKNRVLFSYKFHRCIISCRDIEFFFPSIAFLWEHCYWLKNNKIIIKVIFY